jgi:hypothetical protein
LIGSIKKKEKKKKIPYLYLIEFLVYSDYTEKIRFLALFFEYRKLGALHLGFRHHTDAMNRYVLLIIINNIFNQLTFWRKK